MKNIKFFWNLLFLITVLPIITSCGSDDEDISIDNYLIGKWHTYKAVVTAQNQSVDLDVTKTNQYSQVYYEAVFMSNYKVVFSYYEVDENKVSRWHSETLSYSVKGDVITVYDDEGAIYFFYNSKDKTMYIRLADEVNNIGYTTVFIYFRK